MTKLANQHALNGYLDSVRATSPERRASYTCLLLGHSSLEYYLDDAVFCARCGHCKNLGDANTLLNAVGRASFRAVRVGCGCGPCRGNARLLTWRDLAEVPDVQEVLDMLQQPIEPMTHEPSIST